MRVITSSRLHCEEYESAKAQAICDWGCGEWSLIGTTSEEGVILLITEEGLFETKYNIRTFFSAWVVGTDIASTLRQKSGRTRSMLNPFTRESIAVMEEGPVDGRQYDWRRLRR